VGYPGGQKNFNCYAIQPLVVKGKRMLPKNKNGAELSNLNVVVGSRVHKQAAQTKNS
jgi:ribosomal protein L13